ncbi:MAG: ABC transporter permease [Acidimicrobiia bacterium]|nr:ABC transporter permease [Acidimicrobiia bacterium]
MIKVLLSRLLRLVLTLLAVSFITFMMVKLLPGDPVNTLLPPDAPRTPEIVAQIRADLGLDDPVWQQYLDWLGSALSGDLGTSYVTDQPVSEIIKDRFPVTFELALFATLIALVFAIPAGIVGAYREGRMIDKTTSAALSVALSIPNFIAGLFLIWLFTVQFQIFPSTGWSRLTDAGLWANFETAFLPSLALALAPMAIYARLLRADMIGVLKEDYILSARAKGLRDRYILFRHAFRPSTMSLMTVIGLTFGALLGGTVVIEQLFALPGLGSRLISAINQRDIIVIQGITVFIAAMYVIINTIVDLLYLVVDPRIRKG